MMQSLGLETSTQRQTLDEDDVRLKFNSLKSYYQKEKRKQIQPSGSGGIVTPKWEWYNALSFLEPGAIPGPSECNLHSVLDDSAGSSSHNINVPETVAKPGDRTILTIHDSDILGWVSDSNDDSTNNIPRVPEASISTLNITPNQKTPQKKRARKESESTATSNAIAKLEKTMAQEQDFAYGAGIMIVSQLRTLSNKKQLKFVSKALDLLEQLAEDNEEHIVPL